MSFNLTKCDLPVDQAVWIMNSVRKIVDLILCCFVGTFYLTRNSNVL